MIRTYIANFKSGLAASGVEEGFMTAVAPGSCSRIGNRYYKSDEEFLYACAEAMREEYNAIVEAGIVLQLDGSVFRVPNELPIGAASQNAFARYLSLLPPKSPNESARSAGAAETKGFQADPIRQANLPLAV